MHAPTIKAYLMLDYTIEDGLAACACVISALFRKTILKMDEFSCFGVLPLSFSVRVNFEGV